MAKAAVEQQFDTVSSIRQVVENMQLSENIRARDRALIDTLANGERPFTPAEVEKYQIRYNINWGELNKQIRDANRQVNGALLYKPILFTATSRGGEVEKRDDYSQIFTSTLNEGLTTGDMGAHFRYLIRARNASVCLHGIGAMFWPNDYCILPKFIPLENLLIPTDTYLDFSNLSYFDIKTELTPYELYERTHGEKVDKGWNVEQVNLILDGLKGLEGINPNNYNWVEYPEKMQEIFKQNRCFLNSDAVAVVKLDYFFTKEKETGDWFMRVFLRESIGEADADVFVYETDVPFADSINKVLHCQYGDNSIVAPLKYHSVRGCGQQGYSAAEALNRFRSGLFQHGEEQLRMYFYVNNPSDKSRQNVVELMQYGIIEDGVKIVPESERHQVDANLIESIMSQCRQNLSENSASYVSDINDGTNKERTLGEAQIIQQSATMSVSSLLTMMYYQETPFYEEIVRRSLKENAGEPFADKFQTKCIKAGIPKELLVVDNWRIEPERVLGAGDQSLALQEVGALKQIAPSLDPKSQRMIDRMFVSTVTRDPAKGMLLVPDAKDDSSSGTQAAEDVFGTLMQGSQISLRQGITQNDYITTMLKLMGSVVQRITQTDNMGTPQEVIGLENVGNDIQKHIAILESDRTQGENVKMYGDALGKVMNLVKAFAQRIAESNKPKQTPKLLESINYKDVPDDVKRQMESAAGLQPSQMAVPDPKTAKAVQGMKIKQAQFEQKSQHSQINFYLEQMRKATEAQANLSQEQQLHNQELAHAAADKLLELIPVNNEPQPVE